MTLRRGRRRRHIATHVTEKAHLLAVIPLAVARQTAVAVVSANFASISVQWPESTTRARSTEHLYDILRPAARNNKQILLWPRPALWLFSSLWLAIWQAPRSAHRACEQVQATHRGDLGSLQGPPQPAALFGLHGDMWPKPTNSSLETNSTAANVAFCLAQPNPLAGRILPQFAISLSPSPDIRMHLLTVAFSTASRIFMFCEGVLRRHRAIDHRGDGRLVTSGLAYICHPTIF